MSKIPREFDRVTVNLKKELVEQIDKYAFDTSLTRTGAVAVLLTQALQNQKAMSDMSELLKLAKVEQRKQELERKRKD